MVYNVRVRPSGPVSHPHGDPFRPSSHLVGYPLSVLAHMQHKPALGRLVGAQGFSRLFTPARFQPSMDAPVSPGQGMFLPLRAHMQNTP